jgi:hypothetical protein
VWRTVHPQLVWVADALLSVIAAAKCSDANSMYWIGQRSAGGGGRGAGNGQKA